MTVVIGFVAGAFVGTVAMAFMIGCHKGSKYDDGFSCAGCKNIETPIGKSPCNSCRRDMPDCWENAQKDLNSCFHLWEQQTKINKALNGITEEEAEAVK